MEIFTSFNRADLDKIINYSHYVNNMFKYLKKRNDNMSKNDTEDFIIQNNSAQFAEMN